MAAPEMIACKVVWVCTYIVNSLSDTVTELALGGNDTVFSSVTFTLATAANVENLTLTGGSAINGTGNGENNILIGNNGVNTLSGGAGDDILFGGLGADTLVGGAGTDTFLYTALNQSPFNATNRDSIANFASGLDKIDLSALDANTNVAGDQAFIFIGNAAFTAAGQVRYAGGMLQANVGGTNGNTADFSITLTGAPTFVATDMIA